MSDYFGAAAPRRVIVSNLVVASIAAATAAEVSVAVPGLQVGSVGYFFGNQANASGLVYGGVRCAVAGTAILRFVNPTAAAIDPADTDDYTMIIDTPSGSQQSV